MLSRDVMFMRSITFYELVKFFRFLCSYVVWAELVHRCNLPIIWSSRSRSGRTICVNVDPFDCWYWGSTMSDCGKVGSSSGVASIFNFIFVWKMACSMTCKVFAYTTWNRRQEGETTRNWDASWMDVEEERERESHVYTIGEKKSPLIIVLFFLIVVALLFTIGNENETTKNQ